MNHTQWVADGNIVLRYYQDRIVRYGERADYIAAQDWHDRSRYNKVCYAVLDLIKHKRISSIYDVGCGTGLFYHAIKSNRQIDIYDGVELVPEFVKIANRSLPRPSIVQGNFVVTPTPPRRYDLVINLGGLNSRMSNHEKYLYFTLDKMLQMAQKYVIFNVITKANALYFPKGSNRIGHITMLPMKNLYNLLYKLQDTYGFKIIMRTVVLYANSADTFVLLEKA